MATNKRKGVAVSTDGIDIGPAFVVVESHNEDGDSLKRQLRDLREEQSGGDDPILFALEHGGDNDGIAEGQLVEEATNIRSELHEKIQEAKDAYHEESNVLEDLKTKIDRMQYKRKSLKQGMKDLEQQQVELQKKIALHQEAVSEEVEMIDKVEEERKRQVPRLRTQLSLYASTTGIKWDFTQDDILSGSVRAPEKQELKPFSIDPRDFSPIEIAHYLWSKMDGL